MYFQCQNITDFTENYHIFLGLFASIPKTIGNFKISTTSNTIFVKYPVEALLQPQKVFLKTYIIVKSIDSPFHSESKIKYQNILFMWNKINVFEKSQLTKHIDISNILIKMYIYNLFIFDNCL